MSARGIIATIHEPRINTNEHEFLTTKHTKYKNASLPGRQHHQGLNNIIFVFQETATASTVPIADNYCRNGWIDGRSRFR